MIFLTVATEKRLFVGLALQGVKTRMLYGGNSFLDKYGAARIKTSNLRIKLSDSTSFPKEGYAVWVAGHFVVECIFSDVVANQFAYFFENVTSLKQFDIKLFSDIFSMRIRSAITVKYDRARAKRIMQRIQSVMSN